MRRKLNLIALVLTFVMSFTAYSANNILSKMPAIDRLQINAMNKLEKSQEVLLEHNLAYPFFVQDQELFVEAILQVDSEESVVEMLKSHSEIVSPISKSIYILHIPLNQIENILTLPQVKFMQLSRQHKLNMNLSKKAINADKVIGKNGNIIGGEGVIIGIFDTGIDVTHPDFSDEKGTRILKLWDMASTEKGKTPENYDFGREYTKEEIDKDINAVTEKDKFGHGTHVAGTAAGNGSVDPDYRGIAYNADLIIVNGAVGDGGKFSDAQLLQGCKYIFEEANKLHKPVVLNLSLGSITGPHDGTDLISVGIDEMVKKGNVVVVAAGNEGSMPIHTRAEAIEQTQDIDLPLYPYNVCSISKELCPSDDPNYFMMLAEMWYSPETLEEISLAAYKIDVTSYQITFYKSFPLKINGEVNEELLVGDEGEPLAAISYTATSHSELNNAGNIELQISNLGNPAYPVNQYIWTVCTRISKGGVFDLWGSIPLPANMLPIFQSVRNAKVVAGNTNITCGSPAVAHKVVSVGSFVTKVNEPSTYPVEVGSISIFSSKGPTRDGRLCPIITAPGDMIFSAKSKDYVVKDPKTVLPGGKYVGLQGTSMAAPHVTGAVALMLQLDPTLGYDDIVEILKATAKKDKFTGDKANNSFGYGKIDVQAAINYIIKYKSIEYVVEKGQKVYPMPATSFINLEVNGVNEITSMNIYDLNGKEIKQPLDYSISESNGNNIIHLNISKLPNGVYNAECNTENKITKFRFIVAN